jgi:hypothetical protein
MAGLILLLVLGTEVLDWPWLLALALAGLLAGFRRLPREISSPYFLSQQIDHKLALHDSLSTALFYNRLDPQRRAPEDIRAAQLAEAERLSAEVDVARAVPFAFPKSLYLMAILGLVASSLFALRYGISRTLDLRPPLATLVFDAFHFASEPQAAENKKREVRHTDDKLKQPGSTVDEDARRRDGAQGSAPGLSTESADSGAAKSNSPDSLKQRASASVESMNRQKQGGEQGQGAGDDSAEPQETDRDGDGRSASQGQSSGRSSASQQAANSQHESNGLLDKFRDAMANLLSRLKSQPRQGDSQRAASNSAERTAIQSRREQGANRAGTSAAESPDGDAEGGSQSEGAQKAQSGPGKQGGRDGEDASRQGQSGIGRNDGSKEIREAEQLAAMGRISEIIGKRSQNLTGEAMVEVASGREELRTAYTEQAAKHADSGGEIHRDEIPLAYQHYVQQYFEEIRKGAPSAAPKQR